MSVRLMSFLLMIFALQASTKVREIQSIKEIIDEISDDTLVVFDIDNTVIMPTDQIGSDQWYYFLVKKYQEQYGFCDQEAHHMAEEVWNMTQPFIDTKPVEPMTAPLITSLQGKGTKVFALTARTFSIANITRKQLLSNAIDFAKSAPQAGDASLRINNNATYEQGILFQGEGNDKGQTLVEFIKLLSLKPQKIVFIDDKEKNTDNVNKALQELGIDHIEFRYGSTDHVVQDFNNFISSQKP